MGRQEGELPLRKDQRNLILVQYYHDEKIENSDLVSLKVLVHGPDGAITLSD